MRLALVVSLIGAFSLACAGTDDDDPDGKDDPGETTEAPVDADGDGYTTEDDCDDGNAEVNPGATERCDIADVDEDCDGLADTEDADAEGGIITFHDADADGYGETGTDTPACEAIVGYSVYDGDC